MKHRKLISILLALLLALSLCVPAFAVDADALTRGEFVAALFALSGVVFKLTKEYFAKVDKEK